MAATSLVAAIGLVGCSTDEDTTSTTTTTTSVESTSGTSEDRTVEGDATTSPEVVIETFIFRPDPLEVEPGDTVTFRNLDGTTHTVTSGTRDVPDDGFDESLAERQSVEITFDDAGTYDYFCEIHSGEGMTGQVVVR